MVAFVKAALSGERDRRRGPEPGRAPWARPVRASCSRDRPPPPRHRCETTMTQPLVVGKRRPPPALLRARKLANPATVSTVAGRLANPERRTEPDPQDDDEEDELGDHERLHDGEAPEAERSRLERRTSRAWPRSRRTRWAGAARSGAASGRGRRSRARSRRRGVGRSWSRALQSAAQTASGIANTCSVYPI